MRVKYSGIVRNLNITFLAKVNGPPRHGEGLTVLRCTLRDFPSKAINDPDFLYFLTVHLLDLADQQKLLRDWNSMDQQQQELMRAYIRGIIRK